jgi:putative endonuclease
MGLVAFIVARFSPYLNSPCRLTDRNGNAWNNQKIGSFGETVACHWLRAHGGKILYQNYRAPDGGEVDIVARSGNLLRFIEVKTRRAGGIGRPLDSVDNAKLSLIERGANSWLKRLKRRDIPWRFDVIEIRLQEGSRPEVHLVENVL